MSTGTPQHANESGATGSRFSEQALALFVQLIEKADQAWRLYRDPLGWDGLPDDKLTLFFSEDELERFQGDLARLACELRDAGL
jgi:hypothetical protein